VAGNGACRTRRGRVLRLAASPSLLPRRVPRRHLRAPGPQASAAQQGVPSCAPGRRDVGQAFGEDAALAPCVAAKQAAHAQQHNDSMFAQGRSASVRW